MALWCFVHTGSSGNDIDPQRVGHWPGDAETTASDLVVEGGYAYVAGGLAGLQIIDIRTPQLPRRVGRYDTRGGTVKVAVWGDFAYIGESGFGLRIVDVHDRVMPRLSGSIPLTNGLHHAIACGSNYVYVAYRDAGLQIIDARDPTRPRLAGHYPAYAFGVAVSGNFAYLADGNLGLIILDVSDPTQPTRVAEYLVDGGAGSVKVSDGKAFLDLNGGGLRILDVRNPGQPRVEAAVSRWYGPLKDVANGYAFLAGFAALRILDISNLQNVHLAGTFVLNDASSVAVAGGVAYVTGFTSGLHALDLTRRANPQWTAQLAGETRDVAVSGHYAYVASGSDGLRIFDILLPENPRLLGQYRGEGQSVAVCLAGQFALLANQIPRHLGDDTDFVVVEVSDPSNPKRLGVWRTGWNATDVKASGHFAYLHGTNPGLHVIDFSHPASPRPVAQFNMRSTGSTISGQYLYGGIAGHLDIIDIQNPMQPQRIGVFRAREGTSSVTSQG
ncbi:MAG: hypothetical protein AB1813_24145, partial [Verrucomicrobiota bacterium]